MKLQDLLVIVFSSGILSSIGQIIPQGALSALLVATLLEYLVRVTAY